MARQTHRIAKLTMPQAAGAGRRERLFCALDELRVRFPAVWVSAPAGAGKTILISSYVRDKGLPCLWFQMDAADGDASGFFHYLGRAVAQAVPRQRKSMPLFTAEYHHDGSIFSRRYFEEMGDRLTPGTVIVFDNCEAVAADSALWPLLAHGVRFLPSGTDVIFTSRHDPMPALAGLTLNGRIGVLGWDDLKVSPAEAELICSLHGRSRVEARQLHEKSGGWMAALVVMVEQLRRGGEAAHLPAELPQTLFDFFSHDIFMRMSDEMRTLLVKTAFLRSVSVTAAEQLSGNPAAGRLLSQLSRHNLFTERLAGSTVVYQYHPLFRDFLRAHASSSFSASEVAGFKHEAAFVLERYDQIEEAIELYFGGGNTDDALRLILAKAKDLLAQGRGATLERWLRRLPERVVAETPWVSWYHGACAMSFDLGQARKWFERSYDMFRDSPDAAGAYLSWCGVVETYLFEWGDVHPADPWIDDLETLRVTFPHYPSVAIEVRVMIAHLAMLMHRRPQHPVLAVGAERLETLLSRDIDPMQRLTAVSYLVFYYMSVRGNMLRANAVLERLEAHSDWHDSAPLLRIALEQTRAACRWQKGEYAACKQAVDQGLAIADKSGVHLWDFHLLAQGIFNSVTHAELSDAGALLERMKGLLNDSCRMQVCEYHFLSYFEAAHRSDVKAMDEHSLIALRAAQETGAVWAEVFLWLARSRACFLLGERRTAEECLDRAQTLCSETGNLLTECGVLETRALFAIEGRDEEKAVDYIRAYMKNMRNGGYVNTAWWRNDTMACVCARALEHDIETAYVRSLIHKRDLLPPGERLAVRPLTHSLDDAPVATGYRPDLEKWPWPVRLNTLGRFAILVDGEPLVQGRKSQQKPLALLMILAASGSDGADVGRLSDLLWAGADGDKAQHALEMATHRLRKMLGNKDAVQIYDQQIRLNPSLCRVDTYVFVEGVDSGLRMLNHGRHANARITLENALSLYRGHFIARDVGWALWAQERLRMKYLLGIGKLCDLYETHGQVEQALELCRKGIDIEELSEDLYYRYMRYCMQYERKAEAISAYRRLEKAMKATNIAPSGKMVRLMQSFVA